MAESSISQWHDWLNHVTDLEIEYECSPYIKSKGWTRLMQLSVLTGKESLDYSLERTNAIHKFISKCSKKECNKQNTEGWTALMIAARNYNGETTFETVKLLLNKSDPNIKENSGWTTLMIAANNLEIIEAVEIVKLLLNKSDVNIQDNDGSTALMIAANTKNNAETVKLLMDKSDVNIQDNDGRTALMFATENSNIEVIKLLLDKSKVNIQENEGWTALMLAARYSNDEETVEIIKLLSDKSDVNIQENNGWTALMIGVYHLNTESSRETVKILLDKSDLTLRTNCNNTVLSLALFTLAECNSLQNVRLVESILNREVSISDRILKMYLLYIESNPKILKLILSKSTLNKSSLYTLINRIEEHEDLFYKLLETIDYSKTELIKKWGNRDCLARLLKFISPNEDEIVECINTITWKNINLIDVLLKYREIDITRINDQLFHYLIENELETMKAYFKSEYLFTILRKLSGIFHTNYTDYIIDFYGIHKIEDDQLQNDFQLMLYKKKMFIEKLKDVNKGYLKEIPNKRNEIKFGNGTILKTVILYVSRIRSSEDEARIYSDLKKETKLCDFLNICCEKNLCNIVEYYEN
jgi:ankyrin repeat protein